MRRLRKKALLSHALAVAALLLLAAPVQAEPIDEAVAAAGSAEEAPASVSAEPVSATSAEGPAEPAATAVAPEPTQVSEAGSVVDAEPIEASEAGSVVTEAPSDGPVAAVAEAASTVSEDGEALAAGAAAATDGSSSVRRTVSVAERRVRDSAGGTARALEDTPVEPLSGVAASARRALDGGIVPTGDGSTPPAPLSESRGHGLDPWSEAPNVREASPVSALALGTPRALLAEYPVGQVEAQTPPPAGLGTHETGAVPGGPWTTAPAGGGSLGASSSPGGAPGPPDGPSPGPGPAHTAVSAPGSFFFVPIAALLALLALAAPATFRRGMAVPDAAAPIPFVCALERPG